VILLDEIEKAHPDVFNTLLQVLDDGRLTDGQGRTVDFKNVVLIMTSNIPIDAGSADSDVRRALQDHFKPEFINRLDDIVVFAALSREQLSAIVVLQARRVIDLLAARGITLDLSDDAITLLGDLGYDPVYGARPLKRVIQKQLVDRLATGLLDGTYAEGQTVRVDAGDGALVWRARARCGLAVLLGGVCLGRPRSLHEAAHEPARSRARQSGCSVPV
jgi:ATP-dependent Clp protease ATP-binding subunit ClpB